MKRQSIGVLLLLLVSVMFTRCRDDINAYYERPDYLRGNAYKFLTERDTFSYFLQAVEKAGFKDALDGRGIYTFFAPGDAAFKRYLDRHGKSSLDEVHVDTLKMLVGIHIVEFAFNRVDLLSFSKTSSAEDGKPGNGTSYRFKTLARESPRLMIDPKAQREVKVFQQERFIPVISTRLLGTRESMDFEGDYKMFFPGVRWLGDDDRIYIGNAALTECGTPIDNGYINVVDEVVEPLPTLYDFLANPGETADYSLFKKLYDRFASIKYDQEATKNFAQLGDSLFSFYHYLAPGSKQDLPDIAGHWTTAENDGDYESRMKFTFNCFVPNSRVLENYLNTFFADMTDVEDIPLLSLYYLLSTHVEPKKEIILPSQIDKGLEGQFGELWTLKRSNIQTSRFCSNGILYGIDQILEPISFSLTPQPLFRYKRFSTMANLAHKTGIFADYVDPDRDMSLLLIPDLVLKEEQGMYVDYEANPTSDDVIGGRVAVKKWKSATDKTIVAMNAAEMQNCVFPMVVYGFLDRELEGRRYFSTKTPYRFVYTENGDIYDETGTPLSVAQEWKYKFQQGEGRGLAVEVDAAPGYRNQNIGRALYEEARFKKFYNALLKANLLVPSDENPNDKTVFAMDWLNEDRCMVFAPVDAAWDESKVPTDSLALDKFLKYYFISLDENKVDDYVLPMYGNPSVLETKQRFTLVKKATMGIHWVDDKRLRVTNEKPVGEDQKPEDIVNVNTDGELPYFAKDGVIFGLTNFIKAQSNK